MTFTLEERNAIKASISHWKQDIQARFLKGDKIKIMRECDNLRWFETGELVKCYADFCPLCWSVDTTCKLCPYFKYYKKNCMKLHWGEFRKKPSLKTCNAMIAALEKLVKVKSCGREKYNG